MIFQYVWETIITRQSYAGICADAASMRVKAKDANLPHGLGWGYFCSPNYFIEVYLSLYRENAYKNVNTQSMMSVQVHWVQFSP